MNDEIFHFSPKQEFYRGKVRDVYRIGDQLIIIASDRISAFDHILPKPIPFKGQVLSQIAAHFIEACKDIVPVWMDSTPHPIASIGKYCEPIRLEMVIRGYLAGHAWRTYKSGERVICGVEMPLGMKEADKFPNPIITPATKAEEGHDEDISKEEIITRKIVTPDQYDLLETYTRKLYERGHNMAEERGLLLVDTKYEFGIFNGEIVLIDEIHTPDSSRYYIKDGYNERQASGVKQQQLSKEFVREWLMENGFQGLEGQVMPEMPDDFVEIVSRRYIDLYERITGTEFNGMDYNQKDADIQNAVNRILSA